MGQVPNADGWLTTLFGQTAALTAVLAQVPGVTPTVVNRARDIVKALPDFDDQKDEWSRLSREAALATLDKIAEIAKHQK